MSDPLSHKIRASLFSQLAAMERAGLPTMQAMRLLRLPTFEQKRLSRIRKLIGMGFDIPTAGLSSGLFTKFEASLLQAACSVGSPTKAYQRLADEYTKRELRTKAIKSRMILPLVLLGVADFTSPLPKVFSGALSFGQYLMHCLLPLGILAAAVHLITALPRRLNKRSLLMRRLNIEDWYRGVPWFGSMSERPNARDFFGSLALLVEAGVPVLRALPISEELVSNAKTRREFAKIKARIEAGDSFSEALRASTFAGTSKAHNLVHAGDFGGNLPEVLLRYSDIEAASINQFDDQVAEWVPRLIYIAAAIWAGYTIVRSQAFVPFSMSIASNFHSRANTICRNNKMLPRHYRRITAVDIDELGTCSGPKFRKHCQPTIVIDIETA